MNITDLQKRALRLRDINAYTNEGHHRKQHFHRHLQRFLREVAHQLDTQHFDIRSNVGGIAVSGEVTLHADNYYVQAYEGCTSPGVSFLVRSCKGRKDYTGGQNNFIKGETVADNPGKLLQLIRSVGWAVHDRPLAAQGLYSFRYRGQFGWVMIGAINEHDALSEASRSVSVTPTRDNLERWDGTKYVSVGR